MKDGSRYTYSVPNDKAADKVYKLALETDGIDIKNVKEALFFPNSVYNLEDYQYHFNEETKVIEDKPLAINFKIDEFRKQRNNLFKVLDLEFMKALEDPDCTSCRERIVEIKKYLRTLPKKLNGMLENLSMDEIVKFNPFNNIFSIEVLNGGTGYIKSPKVTISPPDGDGTTGTQMEAIARVKYGKVTKVITTVVGSGYDKAPAVNIAKPEDPEGNVALAVASSPENDILSVK